MPQIPHPQNGTKNGMRQGLAHSNLEVSPPLDELQGDDHQGPVSGSQNPSGKWSETQCWGDQGIQRV